MGELQSSERRSALRVVGGILLSALGLAWAIPAALFATSPVRRRRGSTSDAKQPGSEEDRATSVPIASLSEVPDLDQGGEPLRAAVVASGLRDAWNRLDQTKLGSVFVGKRAGALTALSATCPHAGCGIDYDGSRRQFVCPCHNSAFSIDGQRISGPAPRDMDRLDVSEKGGTVFCQFQRFRLALKNKVPV
ncbi:MAG: Rieske (2Fe-2S) protein [Myxococcales bacterium]|nr:Rieske (2Fe-2S) protein [Myxococcales bacterium]